MKIEPAVHIFTNHFIKTHLFAFAVVERSGEIRTNERTKKGQQINKLAFFFHYYETNNIKGSTQFSHRLQK